MPTQPPFRAVRVALALAVFLAAPVSQAIDVAVVGSAQVSDLSTNLNSSNDSASSNGVTFSNGGLSGGTAFGGGVLLSQPFAEVLSVEFGFLYLPRSYTQTLNFSGPATGTVSVNTTYFYEEVPLLIRVKPVPHISIGAGGYFAHAMGNVQATYASSNAAVASALPQGTQYFGYESNGVSRTDYGLLFAAGFDFPIASVVSLILDARYALGLYNINNTGLTTLNTAANPTDNNKWHDIQILAGLKLAL